MFCYDFGVFLESIAIMCHACSQFANNILFRHNHSFIASYMLQFRAKCWHRWMSNFTLIIINSHRWWLILLMFLKVCKAFAWIVLHNTNSRMIIRIHHLHHLLCVDLMVNDDDDDDGSSVLIFACCSIVLIRLCLSLWN